MNKNYFLLKRNIIRIVILIVSLAILSVFSSSALAENSNEIEINLLFDEPIIDEVNITNTTYHNVSMNSTISYGYYNQPILPIKPLLILLPQKGLIQSINVTSEGNISMGENFNVTLGTGYQNQTNESGFNTSIFYPEGSFENIGISNYRGYSILNLCIYPVYYLGDTGEIYYYKYMNLTISTNNSGNVSSLFRGLEKDEILLKQIVDDYSMNYTYTSIPDIPENSSLIDSSTEYDYLIITSEKFVNPNAPFKVRDWLTFEDLAEHKNNKGIATKIVTVEDIYTCEYYDGSDKQEEIRKFIDHAYKTWLIDYVLLGGDTTIIENDEEKDLIPARNLYYSAFGGVNIKKGGWWKGTLPSDLYYSSLKDSFNEHDDYMYGVTAYELWGTPFDGAPSGDWYDPFLKSGVNGKNFYVETDSHRHNENFHVSLFTPSLNLDGSDDAYVRFYTRSYLNNSGVHLYVKVHSNGIEGDGFTLLDLSNDNSNGLVELNFDPSNEEQCTNDEDVYIEFQYKDNIADDESTFNFDEVSIWDETNEIEIYSYDFEEEWVIDSENNDLAPPGWEVVKHNQNGGTWEQEYYRVHPDLSPDVYVGRAPVGSKEEVSNFVYKTINYENTPNNDPYIWKTLMVGSLMSRSLDEDLREFGGRFKDYIIAEECDVGGYTTVGIPDEYAKDTLYDEDYKLLYPPFWYWPKEELWERLSDYPNAHIINIKHHGWWNALIYPRILNYWEPRLNNDHVKQYINNDKFFFIFATSCLIGAFDEEDCLAEYLTVKTKHGAFATITDAREGWGGPESNPDYTEMLDRLFFDWLYKGYYLDQSAELPTLGEALHIIRENPDIKVRMKKETTEDQRWLMSIYELNLFGDPTIRLKLPASNKRPNKPDPPNVDKKLLNIKYKFSASTTDPEGLKLSYKWEWRDTSGNGYEEVSDWSEYIDSGDTIIHKKYFPPGNSYKVRVKARDEVKKPESYWSEWTEFDSLFILNIDSESSPFILGETVNFNGQASCGNEPYTAWNWDFGDGNYSQQQNTSHTYNTEGTYNVTLNVTDSQNITTIITKIINVELLKSNFVSSPGLAISDQQETFYFNDKSKGYYDIVNWSWDFGDGNTSFLKNTSHVYSCEGEYNVSLTITDNQSNNDTFNQIIYIDSVSPSIFSVTNNCEVVGYGSNVTIYVNTTDNSCGVKTVKVNITHPDSSYVNYTMNNTFGNIYEHDFSDCWQLGDYSYSVWVVDQANNSNYASEGSFVVSRGFGFKGIGGINQTIKNTITGSKFMVSEKGVADNISIYINSGNATSDSHYQCMIYQHNDSKIMGISEQKNVTIGEGWQIFNFSVPKPVVRNNTEYVLCCWSDDNYTVTMYYDNGTGSPMYDNDGNSTLQGHYYEGIYGYPPDTNNFKHEDRKYSIYCCYTPDNTSPVITNVSDTPDPAGFGINVTITADVIEYQSGIDILKVNITYPNSTEYSFNMNHLENDTYRFVFNETWVKGQYNYSIWTVDYANNSNLSTGYSFTVSGQATISVCTIKDSYGVNESINLTDPPIGSSDIGYELLDDGDVLHIWNRLDSYYFDTNSGIQLTNHYDEYWSHNVLMLGYYNNDKWNLIYRTDELSGFNKNIKSDNETFVNATIWKDLSYGGYDFRLAIRYHLGMDDNELMVIPYIKNLDQDNIPYILGFGWEMKDIQIDMTTSGDFINVNQTIYYLNQTLNNVYTNLSDPVFYLMENITDMSTKSLYLRWNQSLNYKLQVKSRTGQYNAPVTLFIRIGTLDMGQEKYTELFWYDAEQVTYYFDSYDDAPFGEAWPTNPSYMVDGDTSYSASTTSDGDVELCDSNNCSGTDLGTISKVELRVSSDCPSGQRDTILRPVFGGTVDGMECRYDTTSSAMWSQWFDITYDPFAPQSWSWSDIVNLDCDVVAEDIPMGPPFTLECSKIEIRVTYTLSNYDPVVSNPVPVNGSTDVSIQPILNITVSDPDGDNMNISWLSNSSGSWQSFGTNSSVGNGTYHQTFSNATENGQWWYWKVNVSDGTEYVESSVYKFYTGCQSKIKNTGSTDIKGYLLIQVQYYNSTNSTWIIADDTINETSPRTISSGGQLGLDTVFNGLLNTSMLTYFGNGTYRIYAAFRDTSYNILKCDDETELYATYQFTITYD